MQGVHKAGTDINHRSRAYKRGPELIPLPGLFRPAHGFSGFSQHSCLVLPDGVQADRASNHSASQHEAISPLGVLRAYLPCVTEPGRIKTRGILNTQRRIIALVPRASKTWKSVERSVLGHLELSNRL